MNRKKETNDVDKEIKDELEHPQENEMTDEQGLNTADAGEAGLAGDQAATADGAELDPYQRIADLESQLAAEKEMLLRKLAEMENYKKRLELQKNQAFEHARVDSISRFLPVYDDLSRSIEAAVTLEVDGTFMEGIHMVANKFSDIFAHYGLERIDQIMVPFNYEHHEALMRQKHEDPSVAPNTVIMMLEPGYKIGEKVIRHAKVMVSE
jgi:molecular chaperone GrpE